ncbi:MAG: alpha/beta hydrolase [Actinomycetota bacterium]|nr:alpha/beta hydrolase [Actinomycetota bacterium]
MGGFRDEAAKERYFAAHDAAWAACPAPDATLDIDTRYGTTRVYRYGPENAPPMVLLHGMTTTSAGWWQSLATFATHHRVYAVDTLGEPGPGVQTTPIQDTATRAMWLDEVLVQLDLTDVHLVGASTGGWHAINQAIHRPDRLASVILIDPTTVSVNFSLGVILRAIVAVVVNRDAQWCRFIGWTVGDMALTDRPDVRLVLAGIREYKSRLVPQTRPKDADLRSVTLPLLALFGEHSRAHDATRAAERARKLFPHGEVALIPKWGHVVSQTHLDHIHHRMLDFIKRHTR